MTHERIVVGPPQINDVDGGERVRWSVQLDGPEMPSELWFEVPQEHSGMLTSLADPAVVGLIPCSLAYGIPLHVEGSVSDELAFRFPEILALFASTGLGTVAIPTFTVVAPPPPAGTGVAAGFSGGIDSYALLAAHHYGQDVPDHLRLTHLLFNNVGSHGGGNEGLRAFRERFQRLAQVAEKVGLPFVPVNSNLNSLPFGGRSYEQVNGPLNFAVAALLSAGIGTWIFASSAEYRRLGVRSDAYNTAFVDAIALPLLSNGRRRLLLHGSDLRRVDKTRLVADLADAWDSLDVCLSSDHAVDGGGVPNCTRCWKCHATLAALDMLEATERFASQFDLEHWGSVRERFLTEVLIEDKRALVHELREFAQETGFIFPVGRREAHALRLDRRRVAVRTKLGHVKRWLQGRH